MEVAVQKVEELIKGARGQAARVTTQNEAFSMLFDAISCRFMADFMPIVAYLRRENDVKSYEKPWFFSTFFQLIFET